MLNTLMGEALFSTGVCQVISKENDRSAADSHWLANKDWFLGE
jgi:hypothetical protein